MHIQTLRLEIQKLKALPPLPQNRQRILTAVNDPDVDIKLLGELLAECPAITARLIGLANSAYFGRMGNIHTLKEAIVHLGLNMVKSLTIAILLSENLKPVQCPAFQSEQYWLNALLNAQGAQYLASIMNDEDTPEPSVAYTGGLLLQLGVLALVCAQPELTQEILLEAKHSSMSIQQIMQNHFETDQYQIGKWVILRWHLPDIYAQAVGAQSLTLEKLKTESKLSQLLASAKQLSAMTLNQSNEAEATKTSLVLNVSAQDTDKILSQLAMKKQALQSLARQFSRQ